MNHNMLHPPLPLKRIYIFVSSCQRPTNAVYLINEWIGRMVEMMMMRYSITSKKRVIRALRLALLNARMKSNKLWRTLLFNRNKMSV